MTDPTPSTPGSLPSGSGPDFHTALAHLEHVLGWLKDHLIQSNGDTSPAQYDRTLAQTGSVRQAPDPEAAPVPGGMSADVLARAASRTPTQYQQGNPGGAQAAPGGPQTYEITAPNGQKLQITGDHVPNEAELKQIFAKAGVETAKKPDFSSTNAKDASGNAIVDPNTVGTFVRHLRDQINPIGIGQIIPFPQSAGGAGWDAPIKAAGHMLQAQADVKAKGDAEWAKGNHGTAIRHYLDWLMPIIGPQLDKSADEFQHGKYAAGAGDAVGLSAALMGPKATSQGVAAFKGSGVAQKIADAADAGATDRVADVISPKVGANKIRFGNNAVDVAPAVARETTGLTRNAVSDSIGAKFEDASASLDAAHDARLNARTFPTKPVIDALKAARAKLTAQSVEGSRPMPAVGAGGQRSAVPLGQDVVPSPNATRVAQIDQAIKEVEQLGPVTRYEPLRIIRQAYDGPAKAVYSPAMTTDYMTAQGGKLGAADVTGALREYLAKLSPEDAAANAQYSLWKKASDVITAAEETDRVRPTVGRTLMARGLGAATGAAEGGTTGAVVGAVIGPLVERVAMNSAPALKMFAARQLASLADALRGGNVTRAGSILKTLQRFAPAARAISAAVRSKAAPAEETEE